MTAKVVKLATERPQAKDAVELLQGMLEQASNGDFIAISVVYERRDGSMGNWHTGCISERKMAGALLEAAVRRVGFISADDE